MTQNDAGRAAVWKRARDETQRRDAQARFEEIPCEPFSYEQPLFLIVGKDAEGTPLTHQFEIRDVEIREVRGEDRLFLGLKDEHPNARNAEDEGLVWLPAGWFHPDYAYDCMPVRMPFHNAPSPEDESVPEVMFRDETNRQRRFRLVPYLR